MKGVPGMRALSLFSAVSFLTLGAGCAAEAGPEGVAPSVDTPPISPAALSAIKCGPSACIPGLAIDTRAKAIALDTYDTGYQPAPGNWSLVQHAGLGVKIWVPGKVGVSAKKGAVRITVPAPADGVGGTPFRLVRTPTTGVASDFLMDSRKGSGSVYKTVFDLTATDIRACRVPSGFQGGCSALTAAFDVFIDSTATGLRYGDGSPPVDIQLSDTGGMLSIPTAGGDNFVFHTLSQTMTDHGARASFRWSASDFALAAPEYWGPGTYTRVVPDGTSIDGLLYSGDSSALITEVGMPAVMPGDNIVWEVYVPPPDGVIAVSHSLVNVRTASVDVAVKQEVNLRFPITYAPHGVSYVWDRPTGQTGFTMQRTGWSGG